MRRVLTTAALAAAALGAGPGGQGAAAYAADLPTVLDLGGLRAVDPGSLGSAVDGAARKATALTGEAGSRAVKKTVPTVGRTGGTAVKKTTTAVQRVGGHAAGSAREAVGATAKAATRDGLPVGDLPPRGLRPPHLS
ncbi:ATP-binding protein [Streptomyces sp. C36]|uniref:ATP-binding protein n=1 Tax=Streptomyces sp. C36 TaxID=3237122 RepID=UPI0034C69DFD